jgi:hypothetical protein
MNDWTFACKGGCEGYASLKHNWIRADLLKYIAPTMRHALEVNGGSIVLTGSFNPTIFQPQWFVRQNLLPAEECEKAEIKVIAPQVCEFQTERFIIQVTTERFSALSKPDANPAPLRDLVAGTFFTLEHTPLKALGLNRDMHFALPSEEQWHRIGDTLVPKDVWKGILQGRVGMRSLLVSAEVPGFPDAKQESTRLSIRVEPSERVKFGLYIQVNEHFDAPKNEGHSYLMERIRSRWEGAYNYAAEVADYVISSILK